MDNYSIIDLLIELKKRINAINDTKIDLQFRIDKAIEYIERYEQINGYYDSCYDGEYDTYSYDNVKEELLDILKGEDEK